MVHVTADLLEVLLDDATDAAPGSVSIRLTPTPAGEFDADQPAVAELDPSTPVLTHFRLAAAGNTVSSIFGVEIGTPADGGGARFVSHPDGDSTLTEADDLAAVVLVAVPPWTPDDVTAYDRAGEELELTVLDAAPPEESVPE